MKEWIRKWLNGDLDMLEHVISSSITHKGILGRNNFVDDAGTSLLKRAF